jgi:hypothetical protein
MKKNYLWVIMLLFVPGCVQEDPEPIEEVPNIVSVVKPYPELADSLRIRFTSGENTINKYPELFSIISQKNIVLIRESEIFVKFINEDATYSNTLCWYQYNKFNPPVDASAIKMNIAFPNISEKSGGGLLETGYTIQLGSGKFPAGTVIGFCLIQDGWKNGLIDYNATKFFTNYQFNSDGNQQHILFKDSYFKHVLIGIEDLEFQNELCDEDYNDIFFEVTDNIDGYESTAIDLANVIHFSIEK